MADAPERIWLQRPCRDPENEWCGEVTWCDHKQEDDDTEYVRADIYDAYDPTGWMKLKAIADAAKNLVAQKGRHNTQIAYERLAALLGHNVKVTGRRRAKPGGNPTAERSAAVGRSVLTVGLEVISERRMKKPFPAYCKDCKFAKPDPDHTWDLRCHHPKVNAKDSWALANGKGNGSSCSTERGLNWTATCGQRGAQWEPKDMTSNVEVTRRHANEVE